MEGAKPVSTPLDINTALSSLHCPTTKEEEDAMVETPYVSAVGCVMYAMVCCRPDIAYAVGQLSCYMSKPDKVH